MSRLKYLIDLTSVSSNPSFKEASREELRTLISLIELEGSAQSVKSIASSASVSVARCKAALAFWEESGVIRQDDGIPTVTEEFEERLLRGEIDETPAREVADSIRKEELACMIEECTRLCSQASLTTAEVKNITALYTQYALSAEYVLTLAAYLASGGRLTVRRLCNEAIKLSGRGIEAVEELEGYIKSLEESSGTEWEIRRILGIYGRNLSPSERAYFKKWSEDYGYSVTIVTEAYDIAALNTRHGDLRYMDKILTDWHEAGCRTVSECRARSEAERQQKTTESKSKKGSRSQPQTPRYGNFDVNEAFQNALERSFGTDDT